MLLERRKERKGTWGWKEWYQGGKHLFCIWESVKLTTTYPWRLGVHIESSLMVLTLIKDSWSVMFEHLSECPAQDVEENKYKQWLMPTSALNPLLENKVDKRETDSKQDCSHYTTSYRQWAQKEVLSAVNIKQLCCRIASESLAWSNSCPLGRRIAF